MKHLIIDVDVIGQANTGKSTVMYLLNAFLRENGFTVTMKETNGDTLSEEKSRFLLGHLKDIAEKIEVFIQTRQVRRPMAVAVPHKVVDKTLETLRNARAQIRALGTPERNLDDRLKELDESIAHFTVYKDLKDIG